MDMLVSNIMMFVAAIALLLIAALLVAHSRTAVWLRPADSRREPSLPRRPVPPRKLP
jgi:hypothetical protein